MNPEQPSTPTPQPSTSGGIPPVSPQAPIAPNMFDAPTQPTQASPLGENYLDQIAVTEPVHVHKFAVIGLIGGVLVLLIVILAIFLSPSGPSLSTQAKGVSARIATLKTVVDAQQKHLEDNSLLSTNATLSSVLTSINTDLTTTMKAKKISLSSKSSGGTSTSTEKKYATELSDKFDDAYQRGTLDRTFAPQMAYELTLLRSKFVTLKRTASSKSVTTFVDGAVEQLDSLIAAFNKFSSTD